MYINSKLVSLSKGNEPVTLPSLTYTGGTMMLSCGSADIDMGKVSAAEWKFNRRVIKGGRSQIRILDRQSTLTIKNVILADAGKSKPL